MRGKKIIFLFLALLLPVAIFLFLKIFGKNQFDVAPLYQDSISNVGNCGIDYGTPYFLPDSVMKHFKTDSEASLFLLNFSASESVVKRVLEEADDTEVKILLPSSFQVAFPDLNFLKNCILLLGSSHDIVLIDNQNRIRGYYKSSAREDIDRLLVEISIILKKY
jgi:hypothetical protein